MLEVTCPGTCELQFNETICQNFVACEWDNITTECHPSASEAVTSTTYIGVILSLLGNVIINAGMNSMRHAHVTNRDPTTGDPIQEFWRIPWWWFGIIGIVGGEVGNLVAYGYAPASIVTPIGAVGVLTNVLITTLLLKEQVRKLNIVGMAAVVGGIVVTVYFAPKAEVHFASDTFWSDVIATEHGAIYFGIFAFLVLVMIPLNRFFGKRSVIIAVFTSSVFGSLTILSAKTFSSLLTKAFAEGFDAYFLSPVPYLAFLVMIITCVITMGYINTAMKHFGNCQVVPTYYALFTTMSVASVGFVFREFDCLTKVLDSVLFVGGIVLAMCGVSLVQLLPAASRASIQPMQEEELLNGKADLQTSEDMSAAMTEGIKYSALEHKPALHIKPVQEAALVSSHTTHVNDTAHPQPSTPDDRLITPPSKTALPSRERIEPSSEAVLLSSDNVPDPAPPAASPAALQMQGGMQGGLNGHGPAQPAVLNTRTSPSHYHAPTSHQAPPGGRDSGQTAAAVGGEAPPRAVRRVTMLKPLPPRTLPLPNTATAPADRAGGAQTGQSLQR